MACKVLIAQQMIFVLSFGFLYFQIQVTEKLVQWWPVRWSSTPENVEAGNDDGDGDHEHDDDDDDHEHDDDGAHSDNNDINDDIADSKARHHYWLDSYRKLDRVIRYFYGRTHYSKSG